MNWFKQIWHFINNRTPCDICKKYVYISAVRQLPCTYDAYYKPIPVYCCPDCYKAAFTMNPQQAEQMMRYMAEHGLRTRMIYIPKLRG